MTSSESIKEKIIERWLEKLSSKSEISEDLIQRLKIISEKKEFAEEESIIKLIKTVIEENEVENRED